MSEFKFTAPHCDMAVLHQPGQCRYCDLFPEWQKLRKLWGIAFTGNVPETHEVSCPSDQRRGMGMAHVWAGNRPGGTRCVTTS